MLSVAVFVSGGGTNLQALLDAETRGALGGARIALVVASKAGVYALERAKSAGVEALVHAKADFSDEGAWDAALAERLAERGIGLVVLAGYLSVVGPRVLDAYKHKILNVHPSLIPSFCGAGCYGLRVHALALARGVKVTGATVHFVNGVVDGGEILLQKAVEVQPGDTPETLQRRVMEQAEWVLLPRAVAMLAAGEA